MIRKISLLLLFLAAAAHAEWDAVAPGVRYRHYTVDTMDIHVARIDLTNDEIRVIATKENQRGLRVSEFAKRTKAIVAINGDYFDDKFNPIGLTVGLCGQWEGTKDTQREGVVAVGDGQARIDPQKEVMEPPEPWVETAVSGWPFLVRKCETLKALPGSDAFTRGPHPRTAVGLSKNGRLLYLVVADGRREGVPGPTLPKLAKFMADELGVCSAINLDGGGSSAMWLDDEIVNQPSDGTERRVANHIAVILQRDYVDCESTKSSDQEAGIGLAARPRREK